MERQKVLSEKFSFEEMVQKFNDGYEDVKTANEKFHVKMKRIYERKNITKTQFANRTWLSEKFYNMFLSPTYMPSMSSFISMCMGLNLDLPTAESLLESLALRFNRTDKVDYAYMFLLTRYQGLNIEDCNKILIELGITDPDDLLGSFSIEDRKKYRNTNSEKL